METEPGTATIKVIAISWLAASAAFPLALVGAALGQALGAIAGGCSWIGITLPLDRQVWALVNQPVLNFASLPRAGGYWLGSIGVPLLVALTIIGFWPQVRSLVAQLTAIQIAWSMSLVAVAWLPLLDRDDGHVVRFLALHDRPSFLVWLAPAVAAAAVLLPTLRLLELARRSRPDVSRCHRLLVVVLHLGLPSVLWIVLAVLVRGSIPWLATVAAAAPAGAAIVFAWFRYPTPYVRPLGRPRAAEITGLALAAAVLWAAVWLTGRPLSDDRSAGVVWGHAHSFNNIRPWVVPWSAVGAAVDDRGD
jgi:hypothetical protein